MITAENIFEEDSGLLNEDCEEEEFSDGDWEEKDAERYGEYVPLIPVLVIKEKGSDNWTILS